MEEDYKKNQNETKIKGFDDQKLKITNAFEEYVVESCKYRQSLVT